MTNFEYIKENLTELDLAYYIFPHQTLWKDQPKLFSSKIWKAWGKWADSFSENRGNMAKGEYGDGTIIKHNPSIWSYEYWFFPDGTRKKRGRNNIVSFSVWLSLQYDEKYWN